MSGEDRGVVAATARDPYTANSIAEWSALMREGVQQALRADVVVSRNALLAALDRLDSLRAAPPSGLTPPRPQGAATAGYSAEEISRLASIREALIEAAKTRSNYGHPWCNVCNRRWEEHSSACVVTRGLADLAWLLARLDAPRESSAVAAPDGHSPVAGAPEGGLTEPDCLCGAPRSAHPTGVSGHVICEEYVQHSRSGGLTPDVERVGLRCPRCHGTKSVPRACDDPQCGDSTWDHECNAGSQPCPGCKGAGVLFAPLAPDVERVVRAAGRLSPGVWRQLGKWLRTREGTAGPWDPDDPPVLAQIANEVDEIADAIEALPGAPEPAA